MSRKIVSANFNDRESPYRWLIRNVGEHPTEAVAYMSVVLTNAIFCESTAFESGFGCSIVAYCEDAVGSNEDVDAAKKEACPTILEFNGNSFYNAEKSLMVQECKTLILNTDGSMQAKV